MELSGECESRVPFDTFRPRFGRGRSGRSVKTTIDLNRVEELGEVVQGIKLRSGLGWIDHTFPVFIRPAGWPDVDAVSHEVCRRLTRIRRIGKVGLLILTALQRGARLPTKEETV